MDWLDTRLEIRSATMAMFTKPQPANSAAPAERPPSKWQNVIDHLDAAHAHMSEAMNLLSMINFDLQRGADFILKYRDTLINVIETNGGQIEQGSVEDQIRDYIPKPKSYRPPEDPNTQAPNATS
jgi:hypothetical protein